MGWGGFLGAAWALKGAGPAVLSRRLSVRTTTEKKGWSEAGRGAQEGTPSPSCAPTVLEATQV